MRRPWNGDNVENVKTLQFANGWRKGWALGLRQRAFRMNITFCVHRALSDGEKAALPDSFLAGPGGEAGPPVEVLWSKGIPETLASGACENPGHRVVIPGRPDLWVPEGCGRCAVCVARQVSLGVPFPLLGQSA